MTPQYAHEVATHARRGAEQGAQRIRLDVRPDRNARDQAEADKFRRADGNKVLVRGRVAGRGIVWDVLKVLGRKVEAYALGCAWQEEAIALAQQCLSGRVFVSMGGHRALLAGDFRTPVRDVGPGRAIELRPQDGKPITESRVIEVAPRSAALSGDTSRR